MFCAFVQIGGYCVIEIVLADSQHDSFPFDNRPFAAVLRQKSKTRYLFVSAVDRALSAKLQRALVAEMEASSIAWNVGGVRRWMGTLTSDGRWRRSHHPHCMVAEDIQCFGESEWLQVITANRWVFTWDSKTPLTPYTVRFSNHQLSQVNDRMVVRVGEVWIDSPVSMDLRVCALRISGCGVQGLVLSWSEQPNAVLPTTPSDSVLDLPEGELIERLRVDPDLIVDEKEDVWGRFGVVAPPADSKFTCDALAASNDIDDAPALDLSSVLQRSAMELRSSGHKRHMIDDDSAVDVGHFRVEAKSGALTRAIRLAAEGSSHQTFVGRVHGRLAVGIPAADDHPVNPVAFDLLDVAARVQPELRPHLKHSELFKRTNQTTATLISDVEKESRAPRGSVDERRFRESSVALLNAIQEWGGELLQERGQENLNDAQNEASVQERVSFSDEKAKATGRGIQLAGSVNGVSGSSKDDLSSVIDQARRGMLRPACASDEPVEDVVLRLFKFDGTTELLGVPSAAFECSADLTDLPKLWGVGSRARYNCLFEPTVPFGVKPNGIPTVDFSRSVLFGGAHLEYLMSDLMKGSVDVGRKEGSFWRRFGGAWHMSRSAQCAEETAAEVGLSLHDVHETGGLDVHGFPEMKGSFDEFGGAPSDISSCDRTYSAGLNGCCVLTWKDVMRTVPYFGTRRAALN